MYITATLEMQSAIVKGVFKGPVEWFASAQKKRKRPRRTSIQEVFMQGTGITYTNCWI